MDREVRNRGGIDEALRELGGDERLTRYLEQNVDAVRQFWELFNTEGADAAIDDMAGYADPRVEFHEDPAFPEGGIYRGLEGIRGYVREFQEHMVGHRMEVEELRQVGDSVLAFLHEQATGAQSGVAVELRPCFVFSFRGGRLFRITAYLDRDKAIEAVRLMEETPVDASSTDTDERTSGGRR